MSKAVFVKSIAAGQSFKDYFQAAKCERRIASTQAPYLALTLADKTGQIEARMWSVPEELAVASGQFVKVEAAAETYKDELQLKITRLRVLEPGEYALEDYLPVSARNRPDMLAGLRALIDGSIRNTSLRACLLNIVEENGTRLLDAPAAKGKHQAYLGGLLEHILNLCDLALAISDQYKLDRDIMLAACVLHDIGKLLELRYDDRIDMTVGGRLYGHILIGAQILDVYEAGLNPETYHHLLHIIASHHGQPEWGAARVPATREAWAFHLIDMLDSKLAMVDSAIAEGVDADGFTAWNRDLGTMLWNGGK
jgi:3'-5' exoribonuclease